MDELLGEFLTESGENLDLLDQELVRFEQDPNNAEMLNSIFRLVHTIKGTCGFLGLKRLAMLAHAAETLMGQYRDGAQVTVEGVTVILTSIDRIKQILAGLEQTGSEPPGSDDDLIAELEGLALAQASTHRFAAYRRPDEAAASVDEGRPLKPGEVTLEELERAWRAAPGPEQASNDKPDADLNGGKEMQARAQTLRVSVDTLEHLMTTVSELVLTRNQLLDLMRKNGNSEFKTPLQRLSTVTAELQDGIMKARMQPIANAWQKLPRLVRDLSIELGKTIEIDLAGGDTELDRQVLELIKDPLTHMVRNSADHGIEGSTERARAGKPAAGKIKLSAGQQGGYIVIEVSDDGRGLDAQKIRTKALATGLASQAEIDRLSDADTFKYIFRPGFSTASAVTGISGRGVGMDVVRANIELIGGTVELKSSSVKGASFLIKIPLTLAIMAALIVEVGGQRFAIPQYSVVELVRAGKGSEHQVERINETTVLRLRDKLVPLLNLRELLRLGRREATALDAAKTMIAVVMQIGARVFGVLVDSVFHTEEIVVKPMSALLRDVGTFSGNTILGDGSVIMIIDPNALGAAVGAVELPGEGGDESAKAIEQANESVTPLLLFRAGSPVLKAVPLSLITRLEEIDVAEIERCKGDDLVQYRGALMPLVHVDSAPRRESGVQPVLVFTEGGRPIGLAIDEIVDIVEVPLLIEIVTDEPGIIGAAIIRGKATEIVDVSHYLAKGIGGRLLDTPDRLEKEIRLLLVDDSQFFRNMLAPLLAASGYRVTVAASGDEALALKDKGETFDLIVSDLEMPEMDGIALAERIKGDQQWGKIPLIALSSYGTPKLVERTRAAGFINHIGKFDRQKLMDTLAACRKEWGAAA